MDWLLFTMLHLQNAVYFCSMALSRLKSTDSLTLIGTSTGLRTMVWEMECLWLWSSPWLTQAVLLTTWCCAALWTPIAFSYGLLWDHIFNWSGLSLQRADLRGMLGNWREMESTRWNLKETMPIPNSVGTQSTEIFRPFLCSVAFRGLYLFFPLA